MGFFSSNETKAIALARLMLKRRIAEDPESQAQGFSSAMVDKLSADQMAGVAESTIASIVETVAKANLSNFDEELNIRRVEQHRSQIGSGKLPEPLLLTNYLLYRIEIEYQGQEFPKHHIEWCADVAIHYFQYLDDKSDAGHAIKYADNQFLHRYLAKLMDSLEQIFDIQEIPDEAYSYVENEVANWKQRKAEFRQRREVAQFKAALRNK